MISSKQWAGFCLMILSIHIFSACNRGNKLPALFEMLDESTTGLHFTNTLTPTDSFNIFHYMYYYNGAGVGAGDFNNDGLVDLFFASNLEQNKLFLNSGKLHFKEVTKEAGIPDDHGWSTGVSVVDINNDGLLDIYICRVGNYGPLKSHNQFLICTGIDKNGVPHYVDKAHELGVDFSGFSTQAAFLDYDMDGDLDLYLLNHSVHAISNFRPRKEFIGTYETLSGDRLFRNDATAGGVSRFTEVTKGSGINSTAIGYGLGIAVSDINLDGYPDIYIGNDFHENDYLYINQHNGTFKEELDKCMMHTSQYTMGVDIADVNNDGYSEIISMDMLPADPYILKRSLGEDTWDLYNEKIKIGYNHQYTRNNLQLNDRNGTFSEVGLYSGIAATDWSWAALWMDFDNDGRKDLFISNGIPKRMNDIDFINYIGNEEIQNKLLTNKSHEKDLALTDKFPQIKIPNKFFKNTGNLNFADLDQQVADNKPTYSNGAIYADLDNDGDLDVVVNNINDPVMLYENKSNDKHDKSYVDIKLKGPAGNINGVGAKLVLFGNNQLYLYEKQAVHGFLSAMEIPLHIGLDKIKPDSAFLVWPDNTCQRIDLPINNSHLILTWQKGLPTFDYNTITSFKKNTTAHISNITDSVRLDYLHKENHFAEFDREPLIPHMLSTEGPALAIGDINNDGLQDVYFGAAKWEKGAVYLQKPGGAFYRTMQPGLDNDSTFEDVDACITDVNNDGFPDLVVASGGNEFYGRDEHLLPRVYLNDGKGQFTRLPNAFTGLYETFSCVVPCDFNKDGFVDLFIGGRAMPWAYGQIPHSYLLQNDGTGKFKDVTAEHAKDLATAGFVTRAIWFDLDKDGDKDLICSFEWGGIDAWINNNGQFTRKALTDKKGWWNFVLPCDIDNDGDIDLVAGNLGLNSRLKASEEEPVRLYYNDFDENGKKEQVLTYYVKGKEIPFANKSELEKQMPVLKKNFLYAEDFAKARLNDLFPSDKLKAAEVLTANYFYNAILINDGHMQFTTQALPWEAQLTSYRDAAVINANNDSLPDLLLGGNYYENNVEMGRYDADWGSLLINKGNNRFEVERSNGLSIKGQVRRIQKIEIAQKDAFVLARNNDSVMVIRFSK
ncbi:MAG: VCBS repeat-containing protein [Niastella sp.]|uniref:VCBS repeat-containing protein n=1 Tax=Niastella sp. TaxID=1869183 RepID=UPI00389B2DD8